MNISLHNINLSMNFELGQDLEQEVQFKKITISLFQKNKTYINIGYIDLKIINIEDINYCGFHTFDSISASICNIYECVFDLQEETLIQEIKSNLTDNGIELNYYVIIDTISLDKKYHSLGIGDFVLKELKDYLNTKYGVSGLILLKSYPLGLEGKQYTKEGKIAVKKLNDFYIRNNFYLIKKDDVSIFYKEC